MREGELQNQLAALQQQIGNLSQEKATLEETAAELQFDADQSSVREGEVARLEAMVATVTQELTAAQVQVPTYL